MIDLTLPKNWQKHILNESVIHKLSELKIFLSREISAGKTIFPNPENIFQALKLTSLENVKVVILGQDPYHGPGQAHGLSFSVMKDMKLPPSLQNIFKELESDLNISKPKSGNLEHWAKQGVLLLNATLTVEAAKPGSHQNKGWEFITDHIISLISHKSESVVFILWGSFAQKKINLIDMKKHLVLQSPHPSPLSSYRGFFGSKPFSKANAWLVSQNKKPISW